MYFRSCLLIVFILALPNALFANDPSKMDLKELRGILETQDSIRKTLWVDYLIEFERPSQEQPDKIVQSEREYSYSAAVQKMRLEAFMAESGKRKDAVETVVFDGNQVRDLMIQEQSAGIHSKSSDLPATFFQFMFGHPNLSHLAEYISSKQDATIAELTENEKHFIRVTLPKQFGRAEFTFDPEHGYFPRRLLDLVSSNGEQWRLETNVVEFGKKDGIWIPLEANTTITQTTNNIVKLIENRHVKVVDFKVNNELPPETFTLEIPKGTVINYADLGIISREGGQIQVSQPEAPVEGLRSRTTIAQPSSTRSRYYVAISIVVAIGAALVWLLRRRDIAK